LGQNSGIQEGAQLAFDPVNFCASNPRVCTGASEVASDVGRVIRTSPKGGLTVVGALIWPSDLSDLPPARPPSLIVYRSMRSRGLLPEVGPTARTLGVRPNELPVRDGMVSPGAHGMSVSPGSPSNLPDHRRPVQFGGRSKDPAWGFKLDDLPFGLTYVPDPQNPLGHGFIAPATTMSLETYESLLESTAPSWERVF
jgi:hypothetical protein